MLVAKAGKCAVNPENVTAAISRPNFTVLIRLLVKAQSNSALSKTSSKGTHVQHITQLKASIV